MESRILKVNDIKPNEVILNSNDKVESKNKVMESYQATHIICVKTLDYLMF